MVFYRKYRPQTIDELDSGAIRETLLSVLQKQTPHAFLFTGPKGLGKTSTARILAKAINCEKNAGSVWQVARSNKKEKDTTSHEPLATSQIEPCNVCEQCVSITNGTNLDILEIDAASNRGIDEIRDLKEKIRLSPVSAQKKVYIIDEVHMLTTEAFNALLKTLEEPPAHAMFILCTTEPHKLPATIVSRCFHISFKPATEAELVRSFSRIVKAEKIDIADEALHVIARLSDRGFRDGTKILEEIVLLANGAKITEEFVESKYQVSGIRHQVSEMFAALAKKDAKRGLQIIQEIAEQGVDVRHFLQELLVELHSHLLRQAGITDHESRIGDQELTIKEINVLFELLSKAHMDMKFAVLPQLPLELAVIEYITRSSVTQVNPPIGSASTSGPSANSVSTSNVAKSNVVVAGQGASLQSGITVSHLRKQVGDIQKNKALYGEPKSAGDAKEGVAVVGVELLKAPADGEVTKEWLDAFWKSIISEMKNYNHTIAGVLRSCMIRTYTKDEVVIETAYKFHKERLDDQKTRDELMRICKLLTGNEVKIGVELKT